MICTYIVSLLVCCLSFLSLGAVPQCQGEKVYFGLQMQPLVSWFLGWNRMAEGHRGGGAFTSWWPGSRKKGETRKEDMPFQITLSWVASKQALPPHSKCHPRNPVTFQKPYLWVHEYFSGGHFWSAASIYSCTLYASYSCECFIDSNMSSYEIMLSFPVYTSV